MQFRIHLTDLVQHQGAAIRRFELAPLPLRGTGEGTFLVTEQLAFQQGWREGGAIQADKGRIPAGASMMNRSGDQLLPDSRFPPNQDRRRCRGDQSDLTVDLRDRRAVANDADAVSELSLQLGDLSPRLAERPVEPAAER